MAKPWNRKKTAPGVLKRPKGFCSFVGCTSRAKVERTCITCEKLVEAGKRSEKPVSVLGCSVHEEWSLNALKTHALKGHPTNIIRAVGAALSGKDVF